MVCLERPVNPTQGMWMPICPIPKPSPLIDWGLFGHGTWSVETIAPQFRLSLSSLRFGRVPFEYLQKEALSGDSRPPFTSSCEARWSWGPFASAGGSGASVTQLETIRWGKGEEQGESKPFL